MANSKLLKEAIADAKAVRETAIANAKIALEEAFTPRLQSILSKKLQAEMEGEEEEMEEELDSSDIGKGDEESPVEPSDVASDAHTELGPESEEETAEVGDESEEDAVSETEEEEVEETISEEEEEIEEEEDEDEIDLDEILREMGYGEEEEMEEEVVAEEEANEEVVKLQTELEEAYTTVKSLQSTINEVNLLNAKLLYANRLFRGYNLTNEQKSKVVENLDRTTSVREVKLVYATLAESMNFTGTEKRTKKVVSEGASKPVASTAPVKNIISENTNTLAERFKQLANIK